MCKICAGPLSAHPCSNPLPISRIVLRLANTLLVCVMFIGPIWHTIITVVEVEEGAVHLGLTVILAFVLFILGAVVFPGVVIFKTASIADAGVLKVLFEKFSASNLTSRTCEFPDSSSSNWVMKLVHFLVTFCRKQRTILAYGKRHSMRLCEPCLVVF